MLFDFADNGDYTTRLNYQVSCAYKPSGSGTTRTAYVKNMGWHFARYGGVAHADEPLYCIEPWRNYAASTSGNSVDRDVTLNGSSSTTGSNVWYSLPSARREAIGLILLYSNQQWNHSVSVTTTKKDSNPNVPLRVATQILIYEIVCGLRDPNSFKRNSTNECGTSGDVFYNAASASVSGFSSCYNSLVSAIQSAKKIPSFCGSSSSNAPTIQLSGDTGSAYDSNGVLSAFSFSNGNGARFSKSGNTLNIPTVIIPSTEPEESRPYPELWDSMTAYNQQIYTDGQSTLSEAGAYQATLFSLTDYGLPDETFGVISIPKLNLEMPLYLGATDENMAKGAAVLSGTSVPIGGSNTNAVIAGHRGWGGAAYFRCITELSIGDEVVITNLWERLRYRVVGTKIIEPHEIENILIQPGRDMVTLLTCHPYASGGKQRYLVYCQRIPEYDIMEVPYD